MISHVAVLQPGRCAMQISICNLDSKHLRSVDRALKYAAMRVHITETEPMVHAIEKAEFHDVCANG